MYEGLSLYAVCLNTADETRPDDFWIECYWAEDSDHAEQQAEDANERCAIVCVANVQPYVVDYRERFGIHHLS